MTPIYDRNSRLVGWFEGEHVFDSSMAWVAFSSNGHVFSARGSKWLGPLKGGSFLDTNGKPVAWLTGSSPSGSLWPLKPLAPLKPLNPLKPLRPLTPLRPLMPLDPLGGWSGSTWESWLS